MYKISDLLQKDMTRKEFLATLGFGVATIFGFSAILKMLGKESPWEKHQTVGYGGGAYGGNHKSS